MEKPKALIVGAGGFVGGYLVQAAHEEFEVICGQRGAHGSDAVALDIADPASVRRAFDEVRPAVVFLLAAMSDIDRCEREAERAFLTNVRGAETVANLCARMNARLLFTSTAAVFDSRKHGFSEEDEPCPLSVYGSTKLQAEAAVRSIVPAAIIARFSLVIGFGKKDGTNSMLDSLYKKWRGGIPVSVPDFEFRNPLHARTLSEILVRLLTDHRASGIYHIGARDSISRYELVRRLAQQGHFPEQLVHPQSTAIPGRAPRGQDHFLLTEKLQRLFGTESPSCEREIARCFDGVA